MPFSIFFTPKGHAIHGSYDVKHLGSPASHGCVRLLPVNAEKLYALVEKEGVLNTTVILTGATPSRAPAVARRKQPRHLGRIGHNREPRMRFERLRNVHAGRAAVEHQRITVADPLCDTRGDRLASRRRR